MQATLCQHEIFIVPLLDQFTFLVLICEPFDTEINKCLFCFFVGPWIKFLILFTQIFWSFLAIRVFRKTVSSVCSQSQYFCGFASVQIKQYVTEVISFAFNLYDFVFFIFLYTVPLFQRFECNWTVYLMGSFMSR